MASDSLNIIFAGTPLFSAVILQALLRSKHTIKAVYTQPDRPAGRGQKMQFSAVKTIALEQGLPIYQPVTLREAAEQEKIKQLQADVMVVVAYGLLLPLAVLQAPRLGCVNVHASLLPRWRGAAPIQRAILAGDQETGITIMQMEEGLDTGPMLYRVACPIELTDTSETLLDKLSTLGAEALIHTLDQLTIIQPETQSHDQATYAHKIKKEEATIDWSLSAMECDQRVRAFNPWPIAQTTLKNQIIRIWEARVLDSSTKHAFPGEIIHASSEGIDVATGKGILRITKMQWPGGRCLPVADILNARQNDFAAKQRLGESHES